MSVYLFRSTRDTKRYKSLIRDECNFFGKKYVMDFMREHGNQVKSQDSLQPIIIIKLVRYNNVFNATAST